jgi:predicted ArsR family transcriptional regulator
MTTERLRARILAALGKGEQSFNGLCTMQLYVTSVEERLRVGEVLSDLIAEGLVETRREVLRGMGRPSALYRLAEDDGV